LDHRQHRGELGDEERGVTLRGGADEHAIWMRLSEAEEQWPVVGGPGVEGHRPVHMEARGMGGERERGRSVVAVELAVIEDEGVRAALVALEPDLHLGLERVVRREANEG